jgi:hypothetical protein
MCLESLRFLSVKRAKQLTKCPAIQSDENMKSTIIEIKRVPSKRIQLALLVVLAGSLSVTASTCQAASIWDWLWGRSPYYYGNRSVAVAPSAVPTTGYSQALPVSAASSVTDACMPIAAAPTCAPVATTPFVPLSVAPAATAYRPTYRSLWVRVPVTAYRPTAVFNPVSGGTISHLQPCNAYTWQLQRVPTTTYRPWFSGLHGNRWQLAATPMMVGPQSDPCGCASVSVPSAGSVSPYSLPQGGTTFPGTVMPRTGVPGAVVPSIPGTVLPGSAIPRARGTTPADRPPSLKPETADGESKDPPSPSDQSRRTPVLPQSPARSGRPVSDVVPIPDLERRTPERDNDIVIPQLLDPQNHTAQRAAHWDLMPATSAPQGDEGPSLNDARSSEQVWDDRGWARK